MKEVVFLQGKLSDYRNIQVKNENTFYLCFDDNNNIELYLGDKIIAQGSGVELINQLYIAQGGYRKIIHSATDTTVVISPNTYHVWNEPVAILSITLSEEINNFSSEYLFEFTSSSNGTSLNLPDSIHWVLGLPPIISPNKTYQVSILNNLALIAEF